MGKEIKSLKENNTDTITTLPIGRNVRGGKWIYTIKENAKNTSDYRTRYAAKGFLLNETCTPKMITIRTLMQFVAQYDGNAPKGCYICMP